MSAIAKAFANAPRGQVMSRRAMPASNSSLSSSPAIARSAPRLASTASRNSDIMSSLPKGPAKLPAKLSAFQLAPKIAASSTSQPPTMSSIPSAIREFNYNALSDEQKRTFLHKVANDMQTHQSRYDPVPTTIPDISTIRDGLTELFEANPDGVLRDSDGSYTSNVTLRWLRHAEGEHNLGRHFTADAPNSVNGNRQIVELGPSYQAALDSDLMKPAKMSICSPSIRCRNTLGPVNDIDDCPSIYCHAYREQPTSIIRNVPGPSSMNPDRVLERPLWNGKGMDGQQDPYATYLDEDPAHLNNRMWEALGLAATTASFYSEITGDLDPVFTISSHADCGRQFATNLCSMAGITDEESLQQLTRYYNTTMRDFHLRVRTAADGTRTFVPHEDGSLVNFGAELQPEFLKRIMAGQPAFPKVYPSMPAASKASRSTASSLSSSNASTRSRGSSSGGSAITSAARSEIISRARSAQNKRAQMAPISVRTRPNVLTVSTAA